MGTASGRPPCISPPRYSCTHLHPTGNRWRALAAYVRVVIAVGLRSSLGTHFHLRSDHRKSLAWEDVLLTHRLDSGIRVRRRTLGDAHVDRAEADSTPFDAPFQELVTETAWGTVWSRETIPPRERSMVTIALLAGLGNFEELKLHLRATANTGASREDVLEVLLHVAVYAGVPRANHAFKVAKEIFDELEAAR